jgi:hypothetical protein
MLVLITNLSNPEEAKEIAFVTKSFIVAHRSKRLAAIQKESEVNHDE